MLKTNLLACCALFLSVLIPLKAQTNNPNNSKLFNRAVAFTKDGDFKEAIPLFKRIAEDEPENINVIYNLGHCYLNATGGPDSAEVYFLKTVELLDEDEYNTEFGLDAHLSLAKSQQLLYMFGDAIQTYEKTLGFIDEDLAEMRELIGREIETSNNGIELMKNPVKLEVHNLGKEINSRYDDHSPLVNADETLLLFTSRRKSSYSQMLPDGQFSETIFKSNYLTDKWDDAEVVTAIADVQSHDAGVCLSADGTELYMLRSDFDGQNLYVSEFDGESWSEPFKLPEGINSRYNETHASINSDKSILFFTSDRRGGLGGLDIYMVRRLPNGEWGVPKNLGEDINTPYDEETPMIHPDGKTLFFSSEGHNSMGKFDIFYSRMNADSSWNEPVNMGYPINTPDDDFFFVPTAAENRAYMASSRFEHNYGGSDLYMIEYEEPEVDRLAVVKGKMDAGREVPWDDVVIYVKEKGQSELIGEYRPNPVLGSYLMILEADKTYDISYQGENIENKDTTITITREMTYLNKQQSVAIGDFMVNSLIPEETAQTESETSLASSGVVTSETSGKYTVQFITLKRLVTDYSVFGDINADHIRVYQCKDGNYRYVFGDYQFYKDAKKAKQEVIKITGYDDSFVRYFWQLDKMKVEEAGE